MSESANEGGSEEKELTLEEVKAEAAEVEAENKKLKAEKAEQEELANQTKPPNTPLSLIHISEPTRPY